MGHHPFWFRLGNRQIYSCLSHRKLTATCKIGLGEFWCNSTYIDHNVLSCARLLEWCSQWMAIARSERGHFRPVIVFGVSPLLLYKEADPSVHCQSIFSGGTRRDLSRKITMKAVTLVIFGEFFAQLNVSYLALLHFIFKV